MIEPRNLSENTRVEQTHDGSGQPDERNSSTAHTIKEQHADDNTQDVISVQTYPSEENKNVRVEQTYDRSGQSDKHNVAIQDDPEVYHEIKTFNIDNEAIRERIEEDMDFKIPGLPHSIVKQLQSASVRELIRKSRTIRFGMLFNETYNRVNHLIPSVQNQNT